MDKRGLKSTWYRQGRGWMPFGGALFILPVLICLLFIGPAGAADQEQILFTRLLAGKWEPWTMESNGAQLRPLPHPAGFERYPTASPDGTMIAYVDTNRMLRLMKSDGAAMPALPLPPGIYAQPAWSADGRRLAFVKYAVIPKDSSEIWYLHKDSHNIWQGPDRLTAFPPMRLHPSFAPAGTALVFTEFSRHAILGVVEEIGILDLTARTIRMITKDEVDSFQATWSPDKKHIAYVSNKSGNYDIWLYSMSQGSHRPLTRDPAYDGEPAWSKDGNRVAFVSTRTGNREIWLVSLDGTPPHQITTLHGSVREPCWIKSAD